jgi:hypothetical protein
VGRGLGQSPKLNVGAWLSAGPAACIPARSRTPRSPQDRSLGGQLAHQSGLATSLIFRIPSGQPAFKRCLGKKSGYDFF